MEIEAAKSRKYQMVQWRVQQESRVETWEAGDNHFSSIIASFTMSEKEKGYSRTFEEFLLRKDEKERWKIVGWRLTDPIEMDD